MTKVLVQVSEADIAQGKATDIERCPVARAMSRALGEPIHVGVTYWDFMKQKKGVLLPALPSFVGYNIVQMINNIHGHKSLHKKVEPFSFEVEIE